ncbi:hypothetical protein [Paenibacillus spongiae]|uniref:DUF4976 domain-containing protein n=1 Tax=Paenibacillus spongiae TaxID=2909671 RepID=A0ABY5SBG7_9BACL|nr:hypothetical protein [Paenibacillus spongiae]UVI30100.1 hypothetical protein L1F29_32810 [Paenibacillus spongiae]
MLDGQELPDWPDSIVTEGAGLEGVMYTQRMIRKGPYKYVFNCGDLDELYDLSKDRHELDNRIDDPDYGSILSEMRQALADWMVHHEDGALNQYKRLRMG